MPGQKLTPQILQTNGNDKDNAGTGGTCFGDSGGPVFLDGEIVAVTSYTYNGVCRYLGGYQRVDRADVQDVDRPVPLRAAAGVRAPRRECRCADARCTRRLTPDGVSRR